jgi:GMP synthase-like glutamine amidotransferase
MAWYLGGSVDKCDHREYGFARLQVSKLGPDCQSADSLFEGLDEGLEVASINLLWLWLLKGFVHFPGMDESR